MSAKWVWALTTALLWFSVIPTHEYSHCLLYWAAGGEGECLTHFQDHYSKENGLAITLRGHHFEPWVGIMHHVIIYGLNLLQAVLIPLALYPRKPKEL